MVQEARVEQLPRGRHRLSREEVSASQRSRLLVAMAAAVAEKGYARTTVADVLARARVSRETFYEHFADKEACFLASYDACVDRLLGAMAATSVPRRTSSLGRFDRVLATYLQLLSQEGDLARVFLVEVYGAGPAARARRRKVQERFVDLVAEGFDARRRDDRFLCEALVGTISSLVTARVAADALDELPGLRPALVEVARRLRPRPTRARRTA